MEREDCGSRIVDCGLDLRVQGTRAAAPFRMPQSAIRNLLLGLCLASPATAQSRPRARELGIVVGTLPPGPLNAITDVAGVRVGHATIVRGDSINTGVTAILPHAGNVFRDKVPAAVVVGNGFGKLAGSTQVNELGELESPIVLTCTLCVPRAADAVLTYLLGLSGNEDVRSANPVVAETNDGFLSDIRARPIAEADVLAAIRSGTAGRRLPSRLGGWTVGTLVQTNFGGILTMNGAPIGRELGQYYLKGDTGDGSVIIVVATDAPLDHRQLTRLGRRALAGLARTGSSFSTGSGDYVIAFSAVR